MARKTENKKFALCIENKDCEDLEKRKIYLLRRDSPPHFNTYGIHGGFI